VSNGDGAFPETLEIGCALAWPHELPGGDKTAPDHQQQSQSADEGDFCFVGGHGRECSTQIDFAQTISRPIQYGTEVASADGQMAIPS
jgi:predicted small lipoprotein YifL